MFLKAFIVFAFLLSAQQTHQILLECRNPELISAISPVISSTSTNSSTAGSSQLLFDDPAIINSWPECDPELLQSYFPAFQECRLLTFKSTPGTPQCLRCADQYLSDTECQAKVNTTDRCPTCIPSEAVANRCYNPQVKSQPPVEGMIACPDSIWNNYGRDTFGGCAVLSNAEGPGCLVCARGYKLNKECNFVMTLMDATKRCGVCDKDDAVVDEASTEPMSDPASSGSRTFNMIAYYGLTTVLVTLF